MKKKIRGKENLFTATDFGSLFAHKLEKTILALETDEDETIYSKS